MVALEGRNSYVPFMKEKKVPSPWPPLAPYQVVAVSTPPAMDALEERGELA